MISFPNNIRFRFRDSDRDAQVVLSDKDWQKMLKTFTKQAKVSKDIAKDFLFQSFVNEIKRVYGEPSQVTLILDQSQIVVH
jgi:hypothetical protein